MYKILSLGFVFLLCGCTSPQNVATPQSIEVRRDDLVFKTSEDLTENFRVTRTQVVKILGKEKDLGYFSIGSGVAISKDEVLTAWHVASASKTLVVQVPVEFDKTGYPTVWEFLDVISVTPAKKSESGTNLDYDLAVLKVKLLKRHLVPAKVQSENPEVGVPVYTIGFPGDALMVLTDGIVSHYKEIVYWGGEEEEDPWKMDNPSRVFGFTAFISPGSSGSPVFNMKNEVVGIVVASRAFYAGYYYAVRTEDIKDFLDSVRGK